MIKVIGFDLDNTLYNQELFEFEVFDSISEVVSENFNIDKIKYTKELKDLYKCGQKEYVFDKAMMSICGHLPILWDDFVKEHILGIYRNFMPKQLHTFDNIINNLTSLQNRGYHLFLITNGNSTIQNNKIDVLNIRKYFDLILISDDYEPTRRKPDIYMFNKAIDYFNVDPSEMIYIGDDLVRDKASELVDINFIHISEFDFNFL
jgi:putative hydrolase of the HAD superfamily